jgi:hypothetical protein
MLLMLQSGLIPNVIEHMGQEEQMRVINQPVSFLGELAAEAEDNVGEISDRSDADAARSSGGAGNVGEISDVPVPMDEGATRASIGSRRHLRNESASRHLQDDRCGHRLRS